MDNIIVMKTWGFEEWLVNNELYCGKILTCVRTNMDGNWSSQGKYHYHKNKDETFFIFKGELLLDIEGKEIIMKEGDTYRIKPEVKHRFKAISPI